MKKFLKKSLVYLIMTMLAIPATLITGALSAQRAHAATLINEAFNGSSCPSSWVCDGVSFSSTTGLYGAAPRSVRFNEDHDDLTSPSFSNAKTLSLWAKGDPDFSTPYSDLYIEGLKGGNWVAVGNVLNVPSISNNYTFSVDSAITKLNFYIDESWGDVYLDDIVIRSEDTVAPIISGVSNNQITNQSVTPVITDDSGSFTAKLNGVNFVSGTTISNSGVYTLIATDSSNNSTTVNFVVDKVAPTATLSYSTTAPTSGDVIVTLTTSEPIQEALEYTYSQNGSYPINFTDLAGNPGTETAVISNIDKSAPVITLNGPDFLVIGDSSEYNEQGVVATDDVDGDITANVTTAIYKFDPETSLASPVENIDTTQSGIYLIAYSVVDSAENIAVEFRMVFVQPVGSAAINLPVFMNEDGQIIDEIRSDFQSNKQVIVSLFLQNGSTISGLNWNGIFNLPGAVDLQSISLPADTGYSVFDASGYEIGAGSTELNLDQPAKIVFYGKAGYKAGYINQTNTFVAISNECVFEDGSVTPTLADGEACKIDVDKDLVIWTRHFTKFVVYSQVVTAPVISEVKTVLQDGQYLLNVTWGATGATNFKFFVNGAESTPVSINGNTATLKVLATGSYKVQMKAVIGTEVSALSNEVTATVKDPTVVTPVNTTTDTTNNTATLTPAPAKAKAAIKPEPAPEQKVETSKDDQGIIKGEEKKDDKDDTNWTPWIILFILILFAGAATGGYFYWFAGKDDDKEDDKKPSKVEKKSDAKVTVRTKNLSAKKKSKRW